MRIQTQGNSNKVWLSSSEGVIDGTMILSAPTVEKILQTVNEKYGTSLESWSQLPTAYEVGDTVPNWDAYEKIEKPIQNIKSLMPGGTDLYAFGHIQDKKFLLSSATEDRFYIVKNGTGVVESMFNRAEEFAETVIKPRIIEAGLDIEETGLETFSYEVGDEIPNWNSYIEI